MLLYLQLFNNAFANLETKVSKTQTHTHTIFFQFSFAMAQISQWQEARGFLFTLLFLDTFEDAACHPR